MILFSFFAFVSFQFSSSKKKFQVLIFNSSVIFMSTHLSGGIEIPPFSSKFMNYVKHLYIDIINVEVVNCMAAWIKKWVESGLVSMTMRCLGSAVSMFCQGLMFFTCCFINSIDC